MDDVDTSHPYYWAGFAVIGDGGAAVAARCGAGGAGSGTAAEESGKRMPEAKSALMDVSGWGRRFRRGVAQLGPPRVAVAVLLLATALFAALFSWQIPLLRDAESALYDIRAANFAPRVDLTSASPWSSIPPIPTAPRVRYRRSIAPSLPKRSPRSTASG
jgi:hypothetical protein